MKILFLDIDNVLNSRRTAIAYDGYPWHYGSMDGFDDVAISLIRQLCYKTETDIVLSSSWRCNEEWTKLKKTLKLPIIDRTPILHLSSSRGAEIDAWLKEHIVEKYAIVDDVDEFTEEQHKYFVQTDPNNGLSYENYMKLKELLT